MIDLYTALDVPRDALTEEIRRAYRRAAKRAHPDGGGTRESFALVSVAHAVLTDAQRRAHYDATGDIGEKPADQTKVAAVNIALNMIDEVLAEVDRRRMRPEEFDIVKDAMTLLTTHRDNLTEKIERMSRDVERRRSLARRFSARSGDNRLGKMFAARAGDLGVMLAMEEKRQVDRAIEILKDHRFRTDLVWNLI